MNPILLNTQVEIYLLGEAISYLFFLIAFLISIKILIKWDFESFSSEQYRLEKQSYLIVTILIFIFGVKFLLLPYFVFTIDSLNTLIPGAMCAAGVISANSYGLELLFFKLFLIFLLTVWLTINYFDLEAKDYPFTKMKYYLFIAIFIIASIEFYLDWSYFLDINLNQPVSCCSALFGQLEGANPLPFGLDTKTLLILFYLLSATVITLLFSYQDILAFIFLGLFIYLSYYAIVYFFGTYIYELPTHKCPFCMFQREYHYIGYLIWGSLFGGVFLSIDSVISKEILGIDSKRVRYIGIGLITLFIFTVSFIVLLYRLRNGVWL